VGQNGDDARPGHEHLLELHRREAADREQALRVLSVGHRREDLAGDGRDAEPGVRRTREDVRIPPCRLVRDVQVTDEVGSPADRLTDRLGSLREKELMAVADRAATESSDRPDPLRAGVL
jgi:hypothetical protein